jgi:hypothetical protein
LGIAAKPVALMQHRRVTVGQSRAFVEMAAGKAAEAIEMRLDMAKQCVRQMKPQQIRQRRIGAIEIHAGRIRRQQSRPVGSDCLTILLEWLHFYASRSFRPILMIYR